MEKCKIKYLLFTNDHERSSRILAARRMRGVLAFSLIAVLIAIDDGHARLRGQIEGQLAELYPEKDPPITHDPIRSERSRLLREFPDGSRLESLSFPTRQMRIREADGRESRITVDHAGYPTTTYVLHAGPDGKIYGSTDHPSFLYVYDPATDELAFYPDLGINFKAARTQGPYLFGATYTGGHLWVLDTSRPITEEAAASIHGQRINVEPSADDAPDNPRHLASFAPDINIPRGAFAHPDGKHIIVCGQPGYGFVGGGIGIHNLETGENIRLNHRQLLEDYSTMAMAALPDGSLLCGTSPRGGHGTSPTHSRAELYILDWETKQVSWRSGPLEHREILSILEGPDGLYYYVTGDGTLVVLDVDPEETEPDPIEALMDTRTTRDRLVESLPEPETAPELTLNLEEAEVHRADLRQYGRHLLTQAMIVGPDNKIYLALSAALLRITPGTFEIEVLAKPDGGISAGLGVVDGRLYFGGRGRVRSIPIPPAGGETLPPEKIATHGAPVTTSSNRGMTTAVDGDGNRVVLVWLMNGGTDRILVIDVATGKTHTVPVKPFGNDNVFVSWHASNGRLYTHYGSHFYEFDPETLSFTFAERTAGRVAMSMHEDRNGVIWAALFSGAGLVSFNPETRELINHGSINREGWGQYTTYMATDDANWVYVGIGNTLGQMVAYNPATGERRAYVEQRDRKQGVGRPVSASNGKVYATAPGWGLHEMYKGEAIPLQAIPQRIWAGENGDYDPDQGDYFLPPHVFRNWALTDAPKTLTDEIMGDNIDSRPAILRAPTGLPAEADRWLWENDLDERFELLIRGRNGAAEGIMTVSFNDQELLKAAAPFERETSSTLRLPVPPDALQEKNNVLRIGFTPEPQTEGLFDDDAAQPLTVYYAVFKRL